MRERIVRDFFLEDALDVAPLLLGKHLVRNFGADEEVRHVIKEVEAYKGGEDLACHACKGRTRRTEIMFDEGGKIYVYLVYGMHWMLNFVTGGKDNPQAVLIRGIGDLNGPGILTRELKIDKSFYGDDLIDSDRLWIEGDSEKSDYYTKPRVGIDYAGYVWKNKPWRFILK